MIEYHYRAVFKSLLRLQRVERLLLLLQRVERLLLLLQRVDESFFRPLSITMSRFLPCCGPLPATTRHLFRYSVSLVVTTSRILSQLVTSCRVADLCRSQLYHLLSQLVTFDHN